MELWDVMKEFEDDRFVSKVVDYRDDKKVEGQEPKEEDWIPLPMPQIVPWAGGAA